jgi:hypothetical protein
LRIRFPFAPIERQLASGRVEVSSLRFIAALPLDLMKYFEAQAGVKVPLPIEEIFPNLPHQIPMLVLGKSDEPLPASTVESAAAPSPSEGGLGTPFTTDVSGPRAEELSLIGEVGSAETTAASTEMQLQPTPSAEVAPEADTSGGQTAAPGNQEAGPVRAFVPSLRPPVLTALEQIRVFRKPSSPNFKLLICHRCPSSIPKKR